MRDPIIKAFLVSSLVFTAIVFGVPAVSKSAQAGDPKAGQKVFKEQCQMCHGEDGRGNPAMEKILEVDIPYLGEEVKSKTNSEIRKIITEGKGKMTRVRGLNETQIRDVIAYLRTFFKTDSPPLAD